MVLLKNSQIEHVDAQHTVVVVRYFSSATTTTTTATAYHNAIEVIRKVLNDSACTKQSTIDLMMMLAL